MTKKATTIWIKPATKAMLDRLGDKKDTYDSVIRRLLRGRLPLDLEGELYRQATIGRPFLLNTPYKAMFDRVGHEYSLTFYLGEKNYGYWRKDITKRRAEEYLRTRLGTSKLNKDMEAWRSLVEKQKALEKKTASVSKMDDDELYLLLEHLDGIIKKTWDLSISIELFDPCAEELILDMLEKEASELTLKEFRIFCAPEIETYVQKEKISLYSMARTGDLSGLDDHVSRFFWIRNTWGDVKILDKSYFTERIKRLQEENEKLDVEDNLDELKAQKRKIQHKLTPMLQETADFFSSLTLWREKRKRCSMISVHHLYLIMREVSERRGIEKDLLYYSEPREAKSITRDELLLRREVCLFYSDRCAIGSEAKDIIDAVMERSGHSSTRLYGSSANPGKAEGIAKIVFTEKDAAKVRQGDVIVAPSTRPEYVDAMKKASAIVTDEGGITSHAAIVSRELGVPCVVGTQTATDEIKDGNKIHVNADHGVVEIRTR